MMEGRQVLFFTEGPAARPIFRQLYTHTVRAEVSTFVA
jgi:hypothetical protein